MARQQPIELFMPPNMLKAKAGGGFGGLDMGAIKRAEAAMENLKPKFLDMAADDVKALVAAQVRYTTDPNHDNRAALARAAHDLKGQAATFGFPLSARVAGSLSKLMQESPEGLALPQKLVEAHIFAIQGIHRMNLMGTDDKTALALIAELDTQVREILGKAK